MAPPTPGVVHHDVQAAEALDGGVDERLHLVGVGDVGLAERRRRHPAPRPRLSPASASMSAIDDPGALGGEPLDHRPTDAAAPPVTTATFPASSSAIDLLLLRRRAAPRGSRTPCVLAMLAPGPR